MGFTDSDIVEEVNANPKFLDELIGQMQERCEDTLDILLKADIEASRGITEEDRSVVLRAFTSQSATQPPATSRRPRRPAR